jgi:hypothetical protein
MRQIPKKLCNLWSWEFLIIFFLKKLGFVVKNIPLRIEGHVQPSVLFIETKILETNSRASVVLAPGFFKRKIHCVTKVWKLFWHRLNLLTFVEKK